ncbi:DUF397 domain-containing protein [Streptomyces sp. NPDC001780]
MDPDIVVGPWRRSSYSGVNGNCLEIAPLGDGGVVVQDSKQPGRRTRFGAREAWDRFVTCVRFGEFDGRALRNER